MKLKNFALITSLLLSGLGISSAGAKDHGTQAVATDSETGTAPRLTLFEPRADILKDGYVYLAFRVDNMTILPMYSEINGGDVTKLTPKIGHLHVGVDDTKWVWIHASTDPIYFGKLSSGSHIISVELVDAAHEVIEVKTMKLVAP